MVEDIIGPATVVVGATFRAKEEAIDAVGALLVAAGKVEPAYVEAMRRREAMSTTYVGNGVAVPHGTEASRPLVRSTGIAVVQVPGGVDFGGGNVARLLVGIAAKGDEHMDLLAEIAEICADDERLERLLAAESPAGLLSLLGAGAP